MFLERISYPEVEAYLRKSQTILLPVGSLENHGKHMPLGTDTLIPEHLCSLLNARFPELLIAPPLHYGATEDLRGFPGTISIGVEGLRMLLTLIVDQLFDYGFRRFIILNGHGGNSKSIDLVGQHLYRRGTYLACLNWWLIAGQLRPEWKGGHGGGEETAAILAVDPSLVHREFIELPENMRNDVSDELPSYSWTSVLFQGASVTIPRPVASITDNGWLAHGMGDDAPSRATEAMGKEMMDAMCSYIHDFVLAFGRAPLPTGEN